MAVTCGFYNALNHDRLYDAIQMSSIFDGIIRDGVFSTIGDSLIVTSPEDGMFVDVGPGRAWFNHTWTLNDTEYPVEAEEAEVVLDRIDAVVLEVNANPEVRNNRIYFVKGTPSSNPVKPTMIHNAEVNQYALAYVTIRAGQTTIFQSDIENVVGTDETPFVTGLLQQVSVERLLLQWNDDFYRYFANFQRTSTAEFTTWLLAKKDEYDNWYAAMEEEGAHDLETFDTWFQHMKDQLDSDAAGHLQAEIDELAEACEKGSVFTVSTEEPELVGRSCVISQGLESVTKQFDANGVALFPSMPYIGTIHVEATDGDNVAQGEMTVPYFGRYGMQIAFWAATLNISTSADGLIGRPITITKGGVVVGTTSFNASGRATYKVHEPGTYIVSSSTAGGDEYAATVVVTEETAYPVNLGIPSGATATPTDDIQTWLKCASIYDKSYTLLSDVLEDYYTCERLFSDSNACDYMARSSSWAAVVTMDASVMEQIGKYDYCCNKLLSNATWASTIINSSYADYVANVSVPTMTSDTTPSGTVVYSSQQQPPAGGVGYGWWAFDNTDSNGWYPGSQNTGEYIGYIFANAFDLKAVHIVTYDNQSFVTNDQSITLTLQGSNTGNTNDWSDIKDITVEIQRATKKDYVDVVSDTTNYKAYRLISKSKALWIDGSYIAHFVTINFYGRHEVQTDVIHSAANDTVYYYDSNNVERQLCVTDANGNGTVDWSEMEPGIYTFYSTVAKNPDNLSEEYSKTVKITKTTTEVYLMPPGTIYWNGYEDVNSEDVLSANGWTSSFTMVSPTRNANYLRLATTASPATKAAFGVKNAVKSSGILAITQGITIGGDHYGTAPAYASKSDQGSLYGYIIVTNSTKAKGSVSYAEQDAAYPIAQAYGGRVMDVYALWNRESRFATIHSAANDTIYYLGENNVHIPFAKTDETGSASVDLGLIPQGTYTLYSSVAKDPDNLSNYYSKTITIGPDTKSIKVMPDGALYWYGWRSDNLEVCSTANGWTYYNRGPFADPTFNTNSVRLYAPSNGGNCGFGAKTSLQNVTKVHAIGQRAVSTPAYSVVELINAKNFANGTAYAAVEFTGSLSHIEGNCSSSSGYLCVWEYNNQTTDVYALWYE